MNDHHIKGTTRVILDKSPATVAYFVAPYVGSRHAALPTACFYLAQ
ncbi:MAG: hypothetical protein WA154_04050 [Moraxellaceae bacterium]